MRIRRPAGFPKITCSKCNKELEENRKGKRRYCLSCHNEYMRLNRARHSELSEDQRIKSNARSYANAYIRRGILKKQCCEKCGDEKAEMHHDDYSKPLQVRWLCRAHHLDHHKIGKEKSPEGLS